MDHASCDCRMSILLVRHGETLLNASRVMQPADTPLGPRGLAQAQAAARRLAGWRPVALLASDLPRAWQTAQAVAAATGLPIEASTLLHERNFGDLRGRPHDSLGFDPLTLLDAPANGESMHGFLARVAQAWAWVQTRRAALNGPLVVVSHGLVIHAMLRHHAQLAAGMDLPLRLANTSVSELEAAPPHRTLRVDCVQHLSGDLADDTQPLSGA